MAEIFLEVGLISGIGYFCQKSGGRRTPFKKLALYFCKKNFVK